jgi:hypothetical protein
MFIYPTRSIHLESYLIQPLLQYLVPFSYTKLNFIMSTCSYDIPDFAPPGASLVSIG